MEDWRRVIRVLTYVHATIDIGLRFVPGKIFVHGYVDSSYNQYENGKGSFGYGFFLGKGDAAFYSVSKRMKVQPLSSTEAEYVAFCEACRDADYITRLMKDIGFKCKRAIVLYEDNESCIDMLTSKHINPKFHYGRDQIQKRLVEVRYVETNQQIADLFTKALGYTKFAPLQRKLLNL
jgi:ribonuclease HI